MLFNTKVVEFVNPDGQGNIIMLVDESGMPRSLIRWHGLSYTWHVWESFSQLVFSLKPEGIELFEPTIKGC